MCNGDMGAHDACGDTLRRPMGCGAFSAYATATPWAPGTCGLRRAVGWRPCGLQRIARVRRPHELRRPLHCGAPMRRIETFGCGALINGGDILVCGTLWRHRRPTPMAPPMAAAAATWTAADNVGTSQAAGPADIDASTAADADTVADAHTVAMHES